jgi:hypothetical protein
MPTSIVKLGTKYVEWSTITDSPVSAGMTLEQFRAYIKERYGTEGLERLPARLARVEAIGTSLLDPPLRAEDFTRFNRAGPRESHLSWRELVASVGGDR